MKNKNCPNCGAVYTLEDVKCPYCGTLYFDMGCLDLSENTPVFIRYKLPYDKNRNCVSSIGDSYAYVTQCAIPRFDTIEMTYDTTDCVDWSGRVYKKYYNGARCRTNLIFEAIPFGRKQELCKIEVDKNE